MWKQLQLLQGIIALFLHLYKLPAIETTEIFTVIDIAKLIANNASVADCCIYVGVRVSENPRIDTAIGYEVAQLRCKKRPGCNPFNISTILFILQNKHFCLEKQIEFLKIVPIRLSYMTKKD